MVENEDRRLRVALGRYQNLLRQITDPSVTATLSEMIREVSEQLRVLEGSERSRRSKTAQLSARPSIVELQSGPTHWSLKDLLAYWRSKQCGRAAPPRSAILAAEVAPLLPNLAVIDVVGEPPRYRLCRVGTELVSAYGEDIDGKWLDELDLGSIAPDISDHIARMVQQCRSQSVRVLFRKQRDERCVEYERIGLPLSETGTDVTAILCGFAFM
jgi:hypothetical protein